MKHLSLFESFEIVEPINYGERLNNREINILHGYNVFCPELILKDDNYYYVFDHRCENIKDLPATYVHAVCKKFETTNYTINNDHTIDVDDHVNFHQRGLHKIPFKFNRVSGNFYCFLNNLTTLDGSPKSVGGGFHCEDNELTTLEGGPKSVGGDFDCSSNELITLKVSPKKVGENFYCNHNRLTSLSGSPKEVGKDFDCVDNRLTTLEGAPESVGENFNCNDNQLTTLQGGPEYVDGVFRCYNNPLMSVEYKGVIRGFIKGKGVIKCKIYR